MTETTVVIKTIGRSTLKPAMKSAKREGFKVIVVSDGFRVSAQGAYKYIRLGRKWGYYGGMAANVGAALAETDFITFLDDDDEFVPGAGDVIRSKLKEKPHVDIWIGGVRFEKPVRVYNKETDETILTSRDLAVTPSLGIGPGNVAMPTYRTEIFKKLPFSDFAPAGHPELADFSHVQLCEHNGCVVDWFEEAIYLVRPINGGLNGSGQ